ncbi:MAG: helix-turn-helix domain-containing protein [Lachnospiraceae bacterium]|nr:helix-turn-helix domain-containing protein [Lachnospiraceae bacterium]
MEPIYLSIQQKETGNQIKRLLKEQGYTVKEVQSAMGFENPQAIYKWMAGRSLPSLDNLVILSRILHISMEDILVVDGDVVVWIQGLLKRLFRYRQVDQWRKEPRRSLRGYIGFLFML